MTVVLRASGISKRFGGLQALADVTFTVEEGEILGLIGPNGAGKTTLFNVLNAVHRPDAGRIEYHDRDTAGLRPYDMARLGMARTHQIVRPLNELTVRDNVTVGACFGRRNFGMQDAIARAEEVLERVGLMSRADELASALNVAQKKRLELARALAADPDLLLLDEVLAGLNPAEISAMLDIIRRVRDAGVTILIIEHVMQALMNVSDRVVVLDYGRQIAEGTPAEVAERSGGDRGLPGRPQAGGGAGTTVMTNPQVAERVPAEAAAILEVRELTSGYGDVQILWEVSLALRPGRLTTLIGSNGAGKTTLLRTVMGLLRPWSGSVTFEGRDIGTLTTNARPDLGLVLVPEGRQLFTDMTVIENLELGAVNRRAHARLGQNLERVMEIFPRLKERRDQRTATLSGGEQQMVAVARGLMAEPRVLMLDELSLGLSPLLTISLFEVLQKLRKEGLTMLLVEQNVRLALAVSDDAYVLSEGRTVLAGPAAEVERNDQVRRAYLGL